MNQFVKYSLLIAATTLASISLPVHAQDYPSRAITFVVPFAPGGSADPLARQFTAQLEKILGGNINIENKPGASGTIGSSQIVRAKPDGYTLGLGVNSCLTLQPLFHPNLPYKTPDDYQSIIKLADVHYVLLVQTNSPWKTFDDFMSDVRKNPGKIRVSVSSVHGTSDLAVQQLNKVANVKIVTVPFSGGGGGALVALLGGRVEAAMGTAASAAGQIQAGKIKALAVFQKGKYPPLPDAASVVDAGYDVTIASMYGVIAPKGLPRSVLDKLVAASLEVVRSPEYRKFAEKEGYTVDAEVNPKASAAMKADLEHYSRVFKNLKNSVDLE